MSDNLFSERLKEKMKERSLRQIDLLKAAEKSGIKLGKSHISQYVSGKTVPRDNIINFLAEVLDTDPEWLKGNDKSDTAVIKPAEPDKKTTGGTKMKTFGKSSKLENVLYDVRGPVVDEAAKMEKSGTQVLKLNIGNPAPFGFKAPMKLYMTCRHSLHSVKDIPTQRVFSQHVRL